MTADDAKALVSRIADEIWNQGALDVCDEVMSVDARYHGPHMPNGEGTRETWKQAIGMYLAAFPDSRVTYEDMYVMGDTVVGRWSATATHRGPLPGLEATGKGIRIGGITIYRLDGDKIVEAWEQLDMLGMWRQLGVVDLPGHER
jgi:predicted ester cyclase